MPSCTKSFDGIEPTPEPSPDPTSGIMEEKIKKTCIKDAYLDFNNWGINPVTLTDWYTKPVDGKVYTK